MSEKQSYLTYQIGAETFATNVRYIQNIIEYSALTKVPDMPDYILGVLNLRGKVLPVIDSRIKLGIPDTPITAQTCIVVLEMVIDDIDIKAGLLVDGVAEVLEIKEDEINEAPSIGSNVRADVISGVYPTGDKFILMLDIEKVVTSEEVINE